MTVPYFTAESKRTGRSVGELLWETVGLVVIVAVVVLAMRRGGFGH